MFWVWGHGAVLLGIPMCSSGGHGHAFLHLFFDIVGVFDEADINGRELLLSR